MSGEEKIAKTLSDSIPKDFLLTVQSEFQGALERATLFGASSAKGHRASVTGFLRHFSLNEALDRAFTEAGVPHQPLKGNGIVFGEVGVATIARFHVNAGHWTNSSRSAGKRKLCEKNVAATQAIQPDFLQPANHSIPALTCFLVTQHGGGIGDPIEIYLVVPNTEMDIRNLLFKESLNLFLQRYERIGEVLDKAVPRLKSGVRRQDGGAEA